jgi:hypothetical protein
MGLRNSLFRRENSFYFSLQPWRAESEHGWPAAYAPNYKNQKIERIKKKAQAGGFVVGAARHDSSSSLLTAMLVDAEVELPGMV